MWWITPLVITAAVTAAFIIAPKGWRTIFVNAAVAIGAVIPAIVDYIVGGSVDLAALLPPGLSVYLIPALTILNMILRRMTTTPIGKR